VHVDALLERSNGGLVLVIMLNACQTYFFLDILTGTYKNIRMVWRYSGRRINSAVYRVIRAARQKLETHANLAYNGARKIEIHISRICDPIVFGTSISQYILDGRNFGKREKLFITHW